METVIRVALIYIVILVGLRIMGKREFSQMSPLKLVALLLIPELVAQGLVREDFSMTNALIALTTLFALVFGTSLASYYSTKAENVITSEPTVLVERGRFLAEKLNKERVAPDEIFAEMHKTGLERLEQVRWAILESDGKISIIPEMPYQHVPLVRQEGEASF